MKISMKRLSQEAVVGALLFAAGFAPALAHAESVLYTASIGTQPEQPSVPEPRQGEPLRLTWQDGRQAVLRIRKPQVVQIPVKIKVTENLCEDRLARPAGNCVFSFGSQEMKMDFAWEKHPDSSKIGQTIKNFFYSSSGSNGEKVKISDPIEGQDFATSAAKLLDPYVTTDEIFDELTCDDFHWMTGAEENTAPKEFTLDAWNSEFMLQNPETGEAENRYFGSGYGLRFVRSGPQTLRLVGAQALNSQFSGSPTLFGDVVSMVVRQNTGDTCQITLKPNLGEATAAARNAQESAMKNAKFVPVTDFRETSVIKFLKNRIQRIQMPTGGFE